MANAFLNMTKTTRLPAILRRAKSEARIGTGASVLDNIGSSDSDVTAETLAIVNECQREFFDQFLMLNVTSASLSVVAGQRHSVLPADLRDTEILKVYWNDGGERDGQVIPFKSRAEIDLLHRGWTSDDVSAGYPEFAVLSWESATVEGADRGKIDWYRMPATARTATIEYRAQEYEFVEADITATSGDNICDVPDRMIPVLSLMIAAELADRNEGGGSGNSGLIRAKLDKKVREWHGKLYGALAMQTNATLETGGYPQTQFGAVQFLGDEII